MGTPQGQASVDALDVRSASTAFKTTALSFLAFFDSGNLAVDDAFIASRAGRAEMSTTGDE